MNYVDESIYIFIQSLRYYNFTFMKMIYLDKTIFYELCKYDYQFIVNEYINKDIDVNKFSIYKIKDYYKTPLYAAVEKENIEIIKLLLSDVNIDINIPYKQGWEYMHGWEKRCGINEIPPIFLAIEKENIEIINILLTNDKIDINKPKRAFSYNGFPREIMERDTRFCKSEEIKEKYMQYLDWRYYGNWVRCYEISPLYMAVDKKNIEIIKLLLTNNKLDINQIYKRWDHSFYYEETAFCNAVRKGYVEIVNLLLTNFKLNINIPSKNICSWPNNEKGTVLHSIDTPLHLAVLISSIDIVKNILKNKNVNVNAKDIKGNRPVDLTNNDEIKQLFNDFIS